MHPLDLHMENTMLEIQNVSKFYTGKTALNEVSIKIPKGCIYGLLGPNGAGKTSLIRIINQITQADKGSVLFNHQPLGPEHIRLIGYLPEERGLYKKIKVIRQLEYFARLRGLSDTEASSRSEYWLKKMNLWEWRNKKVEELSKGMQQKIQFIVAVIHQPELLILDEPFSGFDPVNSELLTEIILELKASGITIIFSTHRMESVEKLCDYMALINLSKKVLDGKVSDIRKQFRSDKFEVITSEPLKSVDERIKIISENMSDTGYPRYMIHLNNISQNECMAWLMANAEIISFSQYLPSIHDIFIQSVNQTQA